MPFSPFWTSATGCQGAAPPLQNPGAARQRGPTRPTRTLPAFEQDGADEPEGFCPPGKNDHPPRRRTDPVPQDNESPPTRNRAAVQVETAAAQMSATCRPANTNQPGRVLPQFSAHLEPSPIERNAGWLKTSRSSSQKRARRPIGLRTHSRLRVPAAHATMGASERLEPCPDPGVP